MNKKLLALAVTGVMFGAGSAFAAPAPAVSINGFADVTWLLSNEAAEENEGQFSVAQTEVNFDTDNLFIAIGSSGDNNYGFGQAFFKYMITEGWNMKGGKFDSNITADANVAPAMEFTQHSLLYNYLTQVGGQSLTGVAVAGDVGPATVTLGYGNDTSVTPSATVDGENSFMLMVNAAPMEGLNLELGLLTQDKDGSGVGSITDINGTYKIQGFTVGLDYATGSDSETGEFDNGYSFWAGYDFGNGFNVKARMENASIVDGDDVDTTELYASYALTDNLLVAVDLHNTDDGTNDFDTNTIEFVGTF